MKQVFLYGTLRHLGLLEIVLGHVPHDRLSAVSLDGYCVARAEGHDFPLILEQSGSCCDGLLLSEVTPEEQARLDYYELGFGYRLLPVEIAGQEALVYFPEPDLWQAAEPWSLKEWSALHWPVTQHSAREIMGLMGQVAPHELGRYFGRIRARAYSTFLAQSNPSPATLRAAHSIESVTLRGGRLSHIGYFRTDTLRLSHPRYDGTQSDEMEREVFLTGDAALVLPYDPVRDRVLIIEQFRMGPLGRGDPMPWTLEPIAGRVDLGETPEEAARRECVEEAGLILGQLEPVASYYPSPGEVSTYFHTFIGLCDLPDSVAGMGGLESEAEDIKSHVLSFDAAEALMKTGEINIGPLLHLLLWLKIERERLRAG